MYVFTWITKDRHWPWDFWSNFIFSWSWYIRFYCRINQLQLSSTLGSECTLIYFYSLTPTTDQKCTFESLFILCFQHWFFSKWHIFQFVSVWSQMWISSTHIMLIGKSRSRCQKWGTIIIVTFYVFVKYSILGIISSSRWIICFFNFLGFSKCTVSRGQDSNYRLGPNSSKIPEKFSVGGLWPVCGSQVVNRKRYVKTDFRTEKMKSLAFR